MSRPAFIALCGTALLTACGTRAEDVDLKRISLPGFSVEVLEGEVMSTSTSPSDGRHEIKLPAPGFIEATFHKAHDAGKLVVEWSSQSYSEEDWKKTFLPTFLETLDAATSKGNRLLKSAAVGKDRWVHVLGTPQVPIGIGIVNCDSTFAVTVTYARYRDVDRQFAMLDRIVKSVQCAVTEANRTRPVAATRLPAKFGRTPDREVQIFQAIDGEQVVINFTQSDVQRDHSIYRKVISSLLSKATGLDIQESHLELLPEGSPRPAGKSSLMRLKIPSMSENIYVGTQYCPSMNLSLIALWTAQGSSDELARERQSQIGCPGEESTPSPSFASIAEGACAAGQKQFCGLKEMN